MGISGSTTFGFGNRLRAGVLPRTPQCHVNTAEWQPTFIVAARERTLHRQSF